MILASLIGATQKTYETWLLKKIETSNFRYTGLKGGYGIFILFLIHSFFLFLFLIFEIKNFQIGEEIFSVLNNENLFNSSLFLLFCTCIFDVACIVIIQRVNATFQLSIDCFKNIFVFIFCYLVIDKIPY